jgi:hypothetical protein
MSRLYFIYLIDFHVKKKLYRAAREGETADTAAETLEMQQRHRSDHTAGISDEPHFFAVVITL